MRDGGREATKSWRKFLMGVGDLQRGVDIGDKKYTDIFH